MAGHHRQQPAHSDIGWYLDHRMIRPGDVVLSSGTGRDANVIKLATGSPFSHAAVAVTSLGLLEALDDGVFMSTLTFRAIAGEDGAALIALHYPDATELRVLRSIDRQVGGDQSDFDVTDRLLAEFGPFLGLPYPRWVDLLPAVAQEGLLHRLAVHARQYLSDRGGDPAARSIFCSELIVELYRTWGHDLYPDGRPAGTVSPAALAANTRLEEVQRAVLRGTERQPSEQDKAFLDGQLDVWSRERQFLANETLKAIKRLNTRIEEEADRWRSGHGRSGKRRG